MQPKAVNKKRKKTHVSQSGFHSLLLCYHNRISEVESFLKMRILFTSQFRLFKNRAPALALVRSLGQMAKVSTAKTFKDRIRFLSSNPSLQELIQSHKT